MKKLLIAAVLGIIIFNASGVFCDEVDEKLQNMATQQVRSSTRMMINNGVPADEAIKMTKLMLEKQFRQEYIFRAHKIVVDTKDDGLPVEPVMNKAYEGMAKQVQDKSVIKAMEMVQNRYRVASDQAEKITRDQGSRGRIRDMIADCSAAGVSNDDVGKVAHEFQERARQMNRTDSEELAEESFKTLRMMARIGVSSGDSADIVCEALKNRYTATNMNMLRNRFLAQYKNSDSSSLAMQYKTQVQNGAGAGDMNGGGRGSDQSSAGGSGISGDSGGSGSGGSGGSSEGGHGGNGGK